jgi:Prohead core protein serine protease
MDRRNFITESLTGLVAIVSGAKVPLSSGYWPIARADVPNGNNRIYSRAILEKSIKDSLSLIQNRSLMGRLGPSTSSVIQFKDASHLVTDLEMSGAYLYAKIEVLATPNGEMLDRLIKSDPDLISFRMTGIGSSHHDGDNHIISDSYKLITVDAMLTKEAAVLG